MIVTKNILWSRLAKYTVAIIIFCVTVEIIARGDDWISYDAPWWGAYTAQRLRTWDADSIRVNVPNARFEKWQNNNLGFRGSDIEVVKKDGCRRIICIGASESYGLYENKGMEWPAQMGRLLENDTYEVINAATVGLAVKQFVPYINKYVKQLKPDVAILFIEPTSYVAARQREINHPEKKSSNEILNLQAGISLPPIKDHLRSLSKFTIAVKQFMPESIHQAYCRRDALKKVEAAERHYLNGNAPLDDVPFECLSEYRGDIEVLIERFRDEGITPILCTYPTLLAEDKTDEYFTTFMEGRRFVVELSIEGMICSVDELNEQNRQIAGDLGIPLVDLANLIPRNKEYFADNVHYTDKGACLVARTMADHIKNNLWGQ